VGNRALKGACGLGFERVVRERDFRPLALLIPLPHHPFCSLCSKAPPPYSRSTLLPANRMGLSILANGKEETPGSREHAPSQPQKGMVIPTLSLHTSIPWA
jgi:hypothetical protein